MRPVYSNGSTVRLSGIGHNRTISLDCGNTIWGPTAEDASFRLSKISDLRRGREIKGPYGYSFHDSCWRLLERCYPGQSIPLERLFYVFESVPYFPYSDEYHFWGHNYGGLLQFNPQEETPWIYHFMSLLSRAVPLAKKDPLNLSNTQQFLQEQPQLSPKGNIQLTVQGRSLNELFLENPSGDCRRDRHVSSNRRCASLPACFKNIERHGFKPEVLG